METSGIRSPPAPNGDAESSSEIKELECTYPWIIKNFNFYSVKPGEKLSSTAFCSENDDKIKWCLTIYPDGETEENKDFVALYLTLVSSYKTEIKVNYKFFIIDENELQVEYKSAKGDTLLQKSDDHHPSCGSRFVSKSFLKNAANGLLPDGNLKILCELSAFAIIPSSPTPNDSVIQDEQWGYTHLKPGKASFRWTICNFSFSKGKVGQVMESPIFSTGPDSKLKWKLKLFPNGEIKNDRKYKKFVSIYLQPAMINDTDVNATFKLYIINSKGEKVNESLIKEPYTFVKGKTKAIGFKQFVRRASLWDQSNGLSTDNKLEIFCEISYVADVVKVSGESKAITLKNLTPERQMDSLPDDLEILLVTEKLSDVTFVVRDRNLRAHQAILAARSPVFSARFQPKMEERRVEITDIEYEVLKEVLCFIYTGKVKKLSDMASALLMAADNYALDKLKLMCEQELCSKLEVENMADMLILANKHNAEQLKAQAVGFIKAKGTEIMASARFTSMFVSHPELKAMIDPQLPSTSRKRRLE